MKITHQNLREISPIVLLSVLLFVSCTQLPVVEESADMDMAAEDETLLVESAEVPALPDLTGSETEPVITTPEIDVQDEVPLITDIIDAESQEEVINENAESAESAEDMPGITEEILTITEPVPEQDQKEIIVAVEETAQPTEEMLAQQRNVDALCEEIGNKLGSVSVEDCLAQQLRFAGAYSVNARPLAMRDFHPRSATSEQPRILIMGGIHGDEYSSISIMFKWMALLEESGGNNFMWRFLPSVNPDGLLDGQAIRQNASGVDLNRNFPSQDWEEEALDYWRNNTGENPRRYPGEEAASEPEVRWLIEQIEQFDPEVIVSVHAPYHLLDFDGPSEAPDKIGDLYLHQLGVYPGSLGNYAGLDLGIPVVTLELPSAGIMPSLEQIETMWIDMLAWLNTRSRDQQQVTTTR